VQDELLEDGYGGGFEGASGQDTARGARSFHYFQYASRPPDMACFVAAITRHGR
jgi:hypothetical protein